MLAILLLLFVDWLGVLRLGENMHFVIYFLNLGTHCFLGTKGRSTVRMYCITQGLFLWFSFPTPHFRSDTLECLSCTNASQSFDFKVTSK